MSHQCAYCHGLYASSSGLNVHLNSCRERIRYENNLALERQEKQFQMEKETLLEVLSKQSEELEKLKSSAESSPQVIYYNNSTHNTDNSTHRTIHIERMETYNTYFGERQKQLLEYTQRSNFDEKNVLEFLGTVRQGLLDSGCEDDLALVRSLDNPDAELVAETDEEVEFLSDKVTEIESSLLSVIKPKMSSVELEKEFEEAVKEKGIFGLLSS